MSGLLLLLLVLCFSPRTRTWVDIYELRAVELEGKQLRRYQLSGLSVEEFMKDPFEQEQAQRIARCRKQSRSHNKLSADGSKQEALF